MLRLGINVDCGESYGRLSVGQDEVVIPCVTSANIACGFHGGDPTTIRRTVRLARAHGVACGAHPSLPDLMGFGRREMNIAPEEFSDLIVYQLGAVKALIEAEGVAAFEEIEAAVAAGAYRFQIAEGELFALSGYRKWAATVSAAEAAEPLPW